MGDRALIQLRGARSGVSPVLYLHWGGSDVASILSAAQDQMKGRPDDVSYAFARLVQQATIGDIGNTGVGVWNQEAALKAGDSHGDAGCFLVDVSKEAWTVAQGGGYGLGDEHDFAVSALAEA